MGRDFTDEQKHAIFDTGKNMLVSASAGSGKTTVMIHRIVNLIKKERVPLTNLLVVTFTNASAEDMKKRLFENLIEESEDEFVFSQIENLPVSDISNLHSFCSRLITTYFYEVNVDPSYHIIDDIEARFLKERALTKLFERKEASVDEDYFKLLDVFQIRRDDRGFKDIIIKFDNFLNSNVDGKNWFLEKLNIAYNTNLESNACANMIKIYVCNEISKDIETLETFAKKCHDFGAKDTAVFFEEVASNFKAVSIKKSYIANARNVYDLNVPAFPKASAHNEFLNDEAERIKRQINDHLTNYKKNLVSTDEEILQNGLNFGNEMLKKLFDIVCEFDEVYSELKRGACALDFNDLEVYALKILENQAILKTVREKYKYVFVDEYQDINNVQEKIISLISSSHNRFMVGDVKQSIYRFRLCDPDIFLQKYDEYSVDEKNSELIKLNCNFRSDKKILRFVDEVFAGVMTKKFGGVDYDPDALFTAGDKNLDEENSVNLIYIDSEQEKVEEEQSSGVYSVKNHTQQEDEEAIKGVVEANIVARKIAELTDKFGEYKYDYDDIAVLVSSRKSPAVIKFIEVLKAYGYPVTSDEKYDLASKNYITEILNFIKLAVNSSNDVLTFNVLKSKLFGFTDDELVKIRKLSFGVSFNKCIDLYENLEDDKLKVKVEFFKQKLEHFGKLVQIFSLKETIKFVIDDFCLYEINLALENGSEINEQIDKLISILPDVSVINYVNNFDRFALEFENECGGKSIKVMTIHKSKGIEFKAVFLINTSNQINLMSSQGNLLFSKAYGAGISYFDSDARLKLPSIPLSAISLTEKRKIVEEAQRVLYVALTRAVAKLYVICTKPSAKLLDKFPEHPSAFINWFEPIISKEINGEHHEFLNFETYKLDELLQTKETEDKQILFVKTKVERPREFVYQSAGSTKVPLKSSVSKILKFKDVDDEIEEQIFSDEIARSSAERGTAYHKLLQRIDLKSLSSLDSQLEKIKSEFSDDEWKLIDISKIKLLLNMPLFAGLKQTDTILKEREFFAKIKASVACPDANEDDTFILQGVIDLIIISDDEVSIVDYKTGRFSEDKFAKYKFQVETYAEACEKALRKKVSKKYLCFIDEQKILEF